MWLTEEAMNKLRGFIAKHTYPENVDDVFQETIYKALKRGYEDRGCEPSTWLCTIAKNTLINMKKKRKECFIEDLFSSKPEEYITDYVDSVLLWGECFENDLIRNHLFSLVQTEIEKLPSKHKNVLVLALENMPYEEIAKKLNIPNGTAKSRCNRARKKILKNLKGVCLRDILKQDEFQKTSL